MSKLHNLPIRRFACGTAMLLGLAAMSACTSVPTTQSLALRSTAPANPQVVQAAYSETSDRSVPGTAQADYMPYGDVIAAPVAFLEMCERSPIDCQHGAVYDPARTVDMARNAMVERVRLALGGAAPVDNQVLQTAAVTTTDDAPGASDGVQYLTWPARDAAPATPLSYALPTLNRPVQSYGVDSVTLPDFAVPGMRQPATDFLDSSADTSVTTELSAVSVPDSDPTPGAIADDSSFNRPLLSWSTKTSADQASLVTVSTTTYQAPSIQYDAPQTYDWSHLHLSTPQAARPMTRPLTQASTAAEGYIRFDLDNQAMNVLRMVNDKVNRMMRGATDEQIYHVADYWNAPDLHDGVRGDCEDFALEKRRLLIQQGVPAAAMSIAIVRTRLGEDHAVLVVSTYQGDYVLDNLQYDIRPWRKANYVWVSRQGPNDDLGWVSLAPANGGGSSWRTPVMRVAYNR